jgi:hypothetical protein
VISGAIRDIVLAEQIDQRRRRETLDRKAAIRRLDRWLHQVETLLEANHRSVPEPLVKDIAGFVRTISPKLHRSLLRNREREASRVLDVLFDAQQHLLPSIVDEVGELEDDLSREMTMVALPATA